MSNLVFCILLFINISAYSQPHEFHHPGQLLTQLKEDKTPEKKIYQIYCANCHNPSPLIEVNAPKFRLMTDWQTRLKQNKSKIFKNVDEGLNAMPPRGGCFECSDKLLQLTIEYMLPKKQN